MLRKVHPRATVRLTATVLLSLCGLASAAEHGGAEIQERLRGVPLLPVFIAVGVAVGVLILRAIAHFRSRSVKAKIFPKLELRRRLYAPYSGGNCATVSFAPMDDA